MWKCLLISVLLGFLAPWTALADIVCDGADDDANTATAFSTFASASTATLIVVIQPTGTGQSGGDNCYYGEATLAIYQNGGFSGDIGIFRNGSLVGNDRLCAFNYDGTEDIVSAAYTVDALQHLALVHSGGNLLFYVNGALVGTTASGDTVNLAATLRICAGASRADNTSYQVLNGRIAEAKVYPVALTATQIASEGLSRVHNVIAVAPSGLWQFDVCPIGQSGDGVQFRDYSGNGHPMTGNHGPNTSGLICQGSSLSYQWGVW